jgi:tripartite-type tricarboxylate transporter receptor subunit TctC
MSAVSGVGSEKFMKLPRRRFLHLAAGAAALPALSRAAGALDYPTRPGRIIVSAPPGSPADIVARLTGQWLAERWGQPFVIETKLGAAGNIAAEVVAKASPDGYTLLLVSTPNAINATLYDKLSFNFIRDIAPVAGIVRYPYVMVVNPSVPAQTVPEFIAYAKANPGKINMASAGIGSAAHVFGELFKVMTGVDLVHVPYRDSLYPDLLAGQVQLAFAPVPQVVEEVRTGKLRALAVTTATRADALPDLPTIGEFVPSYEASAWLGAGVTQNTPSEIIEKLYAPISAAVAEPQFKARFVGLGLEPMLMAPAEFGKFIANETEKWAKVIKFANITPE